MLYNTRKKKHFFRYHRGIFKLRKYGIMVPSGINVPIGKFGKNNNRTPWNKRTPLKIQNMFHKRTLFEEENLSEAIFEGVIDIYLLA